MAGRYLGLRQHIAAAAQGAQVAADGSEALLKHGLQPRRLELEITETALVEDNPNVRVVLDGFQKLGIRLSLDDFGTGYSSLSYLCRYSFDVIKIDRSFTSDVYRSSEARAVVQAISTLADSLELTVVAEGIETQQQLDYIRSQGCAEGQGYLFARPMPFKDIAAYLTKPNVALTEAEPSDDKVRQISDSPGLRACTAASRRIILMSCGCRRSAVSAQIFTTR